MLEKSCSLLNVWLGEDKEDKKQKTCSLSGSHVAGFWRSASDFDLVLQSGKHMEQFISGNEEWFMDQCWFKGQFMD